MSLHETNFEPSAAIAGHSLAALLSCKGAVSPEIRRISYGQVAYEAAVENGLLPEELDGFLAGAAITDLVPIEEGERPAAYTSRAVAEIMVAYICTSSVG